MRRSDYFPTIHAADEAFRLAAAWFHFHARRLPASPGLRRVRYAASFCFLSCRLSFLCLRRLRHAATMRGMGR